MHTLDVDVTDEVAVTAALSDTIAVPNQVSIWVVNADRNGPTESISDYFLEEWKRDINVDLTRFFLSVKPTILQMRKSNYGPIVIMASKSGKEGYRNA